jgi:hypothetical protein
MDLTERIVITLSACSSGAAEGKRAMPSLSLYVTIDDWHNNWSSVDISRDEAEKVLEEIFSMFPDDSGGGDKFNSTRDFLIAGMERFFERWVARLAKDEEILLNQLKVLREARESAGIAEE